MINKKIVILILVIIFIISAYTSYSVFGSNGGINIISPLSFYKQPQSNKNGVTPTEDTSEPKTEICPLNGEMLTKTQKAKWETRRPMAIMIENHKEARPQSGINSADIVYEAVAEGGITRFMAVFYCKDAPFVGPVRSARIYFLRMVQEYGNSPLYVHVGGANCDETTGSGCANGAPADALGYIRTLGWEGYNDMNQFGVPFPYMWRDPERLPGVATEHTVYSSTTKLWQFAKDKRDLTNIDDKGIAWNKNFTSWKFIDDVTVGDRGTTNKIDFGFWTSFASDFSVTWSYDKTTNSYKRTNGGKPHLDKNSGKQLTAKNVIILYAKESPANDGYEGGHIIYKVIGSGDALVFQNGKATEATWNKLDEETRIKFTDNKTDKEISIVRGQVFIEILPVGNKVTY
jgi:hypothetical protein